MKGRVRAMKIPKKKENQCRSSQKDDYTRAEAKKTRYERRKSHQGEKNGRSLCKWA